MPKQQMLISWRVPEYRKYDRSRRWYALAAAVLAALLAYAIFSANFLFAIILIVIAVTVVLQDKHQPAELDFAIANEGIHIGRRFYVYGVFQHFWIFYEPDQAKTLFFEFKNKVRPRLAVPLFNKNPLHIRSTLLKFLPEDSGKEFEPLSEQLSRLLKI